VLLLKKNPLSRGEYNSEMGCALKPCFEGFGGDVTDPFEAIENQDGVVEGSQLVCDWEVGCVGEAIP